MHRFCKGQTHQTLSVAMVAIYGIVALGVDLFHNEESHFTALERDGVVVAQIASCKEPCPACAFLAKSNSTQVTYGSTLMCTPNPPVFFHLPDSRLVVSHECTGSTILLRAPPFATTS
jgi:hypothetical protein